MGEDIPCTLQLLQLLTKNPEGSTSKETVAPALCQKDGCTENEFKQISCLPDMAVGFKGDVHLTGFSGLPGSC